MTNIKWENPSRQPAPARPSKHHDLVAALRRHPGKWA